MLFQLLPSGRGEPVVLGLAIVLGWPPLGLEPAVLLEAIQRRKQRSWVDLEVVAAERGQLLRDAVPVHRFARKDGEDHQIESPLRHIQLVHAHSFRSPNGTTSYGWFL